MEKKRQSRFHRKTRFPNSHSLYPRFSRKTRKNHINAPHLPCLPQQYFMKSQQQPEWSALAHSLDHCATLGSIIDTIEFSKKPKPKSTKTCSETQSISSSQSIETKEKSKVWTAEEIELFAILLRKYGTDFHILSAFFPKKTKNQLKNRYKLYINLERKRERTESNNLRALSQLFKEVEEMDEKDQKEEQAIDMHKL